MKKKKKKKSGKGKNLLVKYQELNTKGSFKNTGLKTLVDLVMGSVLGSGIGAASGIISIPIGVGLIGASHYFDKDTGVLRVAGSASIAYGIAKIREHRKLEVVATTQEVSGIGEEVKNRLVKFKDELINSFYIDKVLPKKSDEKTASEASNETESIEGISEEDLQALDVFEHNNQVQADSFEENENDGLEYEQLHEPEQEFEEFSYAIIEEPDLSNI